MNHCMQARYYQEFVIILKLYHTSMMSLYLQCCVMMENCVVHLVQLMIVLLEKLVTQYTKLLLLATSV